MENNHILIIGEKGAGKTTLISKLALEMPKPLTGFITVSSNRDLEGYHSIYIFNINDRKRIMTDNCKVGICNGRSRTVFTNVFETIGVKYIMEKGSSVIMDEIGFMEEKATLFHEAILLRLNSSLPVIAAVREGTETPFLSKIKNYPNIRVISLSPENREQVFLELLPIVRNW